MIFVIKEFDGGFVYKRHQKLKNKFCMCSNFTGIAVPAVGIFKIDNEMKPLCSDCLYDMLYSKTWNPIELGYENGSIYIEELEYLDNIYIGNQPATFITSNSDTPCDDVESRIIDMIRDI